MILLLLLLLVACDDEAGGGGGGRQTELIETMGPAEILVGGGYQVLSCHEADDGSEYCWDRTAEFYTVDGTLILEATTDPHWWRVSTW